MKKYLTLFTVFCLLQVNGQAPYVTTFNYNDVSARLSSNGIFFKDQNNNLAAYKVPKQSNVTAIYHMSFSVSAKDQNNQDRFSVTTFDSSDFSCGPIATNYLDANYVSKYGNIIWKVSALEIDDHIQNWNTSSYVVPGNIAQWPGNGDVSNGMAAQLAPYVDVNGNNTYDPENGDYPDILGDQACYVIMNDQNNSKFPNTAPLDMELHCMFYQYATNDPLWTTTFVNIKAYNRSSIVLNDLKFNVFTDFDMGNYADDFGGTDVDRNLAYVYNGDNLDDNYNGFPGYGANPPAIGMLSLNHDLISSTFPDSIPIIVSEFSNVMNGYQVDGTAIMNGATPTVFQFSDTLSTGYNELALNHTPGDRRNFSTVSLETFAPNSIKCMDFAWIYARQTAGTSLLKSTDSLMKIADYVQTFYDNTNHCMDGTLQVSNLDQEDFFNIYPNPSTGIINCVSNQVLEHVEVWNMEGRLIRVIQTSGKELTMDLSELENGIYLIKVTTCTEAKTLPFYKQ